MDSLWTQSDVTKVREIIQRIFWGSPYWCQSHPQPISSPFRVATYFLAATLMQVSYLKSYPFSPLLELIFMKILVENMREAKQKLVFIFEQHQISSFQLCTKMILQNFVRILLLFHHEYSNYTTIKIKRITLMRKTEIKHYSLDVFSNMNTLKAPKRLMFYFFFIVV